MKSGLSAEFCGTAIFHIQPLWGWVYQISFPQVSPVAIPPLGLIIAVLAFLKLFF
jgi:hypothetical protein